MGIWGKAISKAFPSVALEDYEFVVQVKRKEKPATLESTTPRFEEVAKTCLAAGCAVALVIMPCAIGLKLINNVF